MTQIGSAIAPTSVARQDRPDPMKVPEATPLFWVAKLITIASGEAFSDFISCNDDIEQHQAILIGLGSFGPA